MLSLLDAALADQLHRDRSAMTLVRSTMLRRFTHHADDENAAG